MNPLSFATTNSDKFKIANIICHDANIRLEQANLDIDEIQGEDPLPIVSDKAMRAYEQLQQPVIVSDDSWEIPALGGFPGAYMKSINQWFTADDFLRLMHGVEDRRIILHQYLAYTDGTKTQVFHNSIPGIVSHEARGVNVKSPSCEITMLDGDNGLTIAEVVVQNTTQLSERSKQQPNVWHAFTEWAHQTIN